MGTLALAVGVALVGTTALLAASCLRLDSAVAFLLAAYLVASAEVVVVALALSTVRELTRAALLASIAAPAVVAVALWMRAGHPAPPLRDAVPAARAALRDRAAATLAALAVVTHTYLLAVGLTVPQNLPDTMIYHLPRAALWKQQEAISYVPHAPDARIDVFPPVAEIEVMSSMLLGGGDRFVTCVQLLALVCACVAIVGVASRLGLGGSAAAFGASAFATFTVVALQAPTALNDLVVAALLITCAYFAMGSSRTELALAAVALALAVGTKGTVIFAAPVLALFALASQPRSRQPRMLAVGAVSLAVGSFWFAVNLVETGELARGSGLGQGEGSSTTALLDRIRLFVVDLFEGSETEGAGLLASPALRLSVLALAVVLAIALAVGGRRRASAAAVLAGIVAFFTLPLLARWLDIAGRALAQGGAAVGIGNGPSGRLPEGYYESPMHSSYGLAFVVLFFGAGALVVGDVVRRRRSPLMLVCLAGVPSALLLMAVALDYDPQRMRYIAFSVALASAVFGIALRARPLAWTAVGATVVSLAVLVGYVVPRPAGLALLARNRASESAARWFVQGGSVHGDRTAFRFLEQRIPTDATVALDVVPDTYVYPAWDAGLRRTVLFVPESGEVPEDAQWLVVGPARSVDDAAISAEWARNFASAGGWRIYSRRPD